MGDALSAGTSDAGESPRPGRPAMSSGGDDEEGRAYSDHDERHGNPLTPSRASYSPMLRGRPAKHGTWISQWTQGQHRWWHLRSLLRSARPSPQQGLAAVRSTAWQAAVSLPARARIWCG